LKINGLINQKKIRTIAKLIAKYFILPTFSLNVKKINKEKIKVIKSEIPIIGLFKPITEFDRCWCINNKKNGIVNFRLIISSII
jgi:hypothetical protein